MTQIRRQTRRAFFGLSMAAAVAGFASAALAADALNIGAYPTNPPFETKLTTGAF